VKTSIRSSRLRSLGFDAIHVHLHRGEGEDAAEGGPAHDPKSGQFTAGQAVRHKELTAAGHEHKGKVDGEHLYNHPKTGTRTTVHSGGEMTQTHPAGGALNPRPAAPMNTSRYPDRNFNRHGERRTK
jgi:hypothetical protein